MSLMEERTAGVTDDPGPEGAGLLEDPAGGSPRVSIGLPVYNGGRLMIEAIDAILAQTFTDFELIISDNASQDGTPEICRELVARDSRVRYYRNPTNIGAVGNHNRLVELARGEYFKWTGHDDLIEPTFLEKCVGVLDADTDGRYVLCFTKLDYIDDDGEPMPGGIQAPVFADDRPSRRLRSFWSAQRMHQVQYGVIRRDRLVRTALEGEWYGSDRQLLMELALLGGFARVDEVLFHHREHRGRSEFVRDKSGWMSTARSGSLDMGYWRRIALVSEILERDYLTPRERRAVLREYLRYAAVRATHWIPQLSRELAGAAARGVATVTKGPARVQ